MARTRNAAKTEEERVRRRKAVYRRHHLKKMYGITVEDYNKMFIEQSGMCAVCKTTEPGGKHGNDTFMVDHDHETGKVRSLLCNKCNMAIGLIRDSIELSKRITEYLCLHTTTAP